MVKNRLALCVAAATLCAAGPAMAGDGTNLMKMIPAETQLVMVFDIADARDSALLQKGWSSLMAAKPEAQAKLAEIGLDPLKDLDTVLLAGTPKGDDFDDMASMVIIVEGRIPKDKLATIPGSKATKYGGTTIWTKDDNDVAMVGDKLFFTKAGKMKAAIDLAQGKGKGKGANAAVSKKAVKLRAAVAATDTAADVWMTMLLPESAKEQMKAQGMIADIVSFGANFNADIGVGLRVVTDSDATAGKMVGMIQQAMGMAAQQAQQFGLGKVAKSLTVGQDKAMVKMGLTLTEADLQTIMNLAGMAGGKPATAAPPAGSKSTGSMTPPPSGGSKPKTP